jgi:hypothetical protein
MPDEIAGFFMQAGEVRFVGKLNLSYPAVTDRTVTRTEMSETACISDR